MIQKERYGYDLALKPLLHARRHGAKRCVHLAWRATENQANDSIASNLYVLEGAEDVDFATEHNQHQTALSNVFIFPTYVSAKTIRVLLAFSIVNLVFPSRPAIRPIARDK